jgi:MFS family permease
MSQAPVQEPLAKASVKRQRFLAALAVVPILATVYQTIVLTDLTADAVRKGIEGDSYQMIWTNVAWGVATIYGIFLAMWAMTRFGQRLSMCVGLFLFALGNLLCGAATDVTTMTVAKLSRELARGCRL